MNMCSYPQNQLKQMSNSGRRRIYTQKIEAFHDLANAGNEFRCRRMESDIHRNMNDLLSLGMVSQERAKKTTVPNIKPNTFVTFSLFFCRSR